MRRWTQAIVALTLTLVILTEGVGALAQESIPLTPVHDSGGVAECTVEPANLDRVSEIAGSAVDDPDAVLGFESPIAGGEIMTGPDADAVIALMDQLIACVNAMDAARFLSLFSDDFIRRYAHDIAGFLDEAETANEPADGSGDTVEEANDPVIIVGAGDVYAQPDGRLTYSVSIGSMDVVNSDNIPLPFSLIQIIAAEQRGEWKIDDLREQEIADATSQPDCATDGADGCAGATPAVVSAGYVEGVGYAGWLMPVKASAEAAPWLSGIDEESAVPFQPNEAEVADAEAALPAFVADHPNATDRIIEELNTGFYARQYLGYVTPDGPILVINAYCGEPFGDPATEVEIVMDGGDCYWQATYDLATGEFTSLSVNGDA